MLKYVIEPTLLPFAFRMFLPDIFDLSLQLHFLKDLPCESLYKATSLRFSCRQAEGVSDRVEPPTPQNPSARQMRRWMYPCLPAALQSKKNHVTLIKSSSSGKLVSRNQSIIRRMKTLRRLPLNPVMCPTFSTSYTVFLFQYIMVVIHFFKKVWANESELMGQFTSEFLCSYILPVRYTFGVSWSCFLMLLIYSVVMCVPLWMGTNMTMTHRGWWSQIISVGPVDPNVSVEQSLLVFPALWLKMMSASESPLPWSMACQMHYYWWDPNIAVSIIAVLLFRNKLLSALLFKNVI